MEIIYYCKQGDPYCVYPKCKCNTMNIDMEFNQDYEDQQRESDEIVNDFEN